MKYFIFTSVLLLNSVMSGEAMADCATNQLTDASNPTLNDLLSGHTVCEAAGDAAATGPDQSWGVQEEHRSGGELWDYKRGPSSTIDPTKLIGAWSVSGTGANTVVNYSYLAGGGGGIYKVYNNGNASYDICNGPARVATVTVVPSIGSGCSGFAHGAP